MKMKRSKTVKVMIKTSMLRRNLKLPMKGEMVESQKKMTLKTAMMN